MIVEHKKQAPVKYECGTPIEECSGSIDPRFGGKNQTRKMITLHSSAVEARLCFTRHMQRQGYTRIGHTFVRPGEPIHA